MQFIDIELFCLISITRFSLAMTHIIIIVSFATILGQSAMIFELSDAEGLLTGQLWACAHNIIWTTIKARILSRSDHEVR